MTLNFGIAPDPVIDCSLTGWPDDKRSSFFEAAAELPDVHRVGGAGISTARIYHSVDADTDLLKLRLAETANAVFPGYNFHV